jgi:2-methylcitrate dehydratase PrpD
VLGLSAQQTKWALGIASAHAAGLVETLGSMAKSVSVGNAARHGLLSALLARDGFIGPDRPLEGPRGFLQVTGDKPDFARVTDRLGKDWEISSNAYKPYPCGVVLNPVIEACIAIAEHDHPEASAIERIEITGRALLRERTDRQRPQSGREAQVSAQHSAAVALTRGRATLADYTDAATYDPVLNSVGAKVRFIDDPSYPVEAARVTVRLSSGKECAYKVDNARGSSTNPLTDRDLEQKLRDLIEFGKSSADASALIDAVWSIDSNPDAASVIRLAAGGRP